MHLILLLLVNCFVAISAFGADASPAKLKYGTWGFDLSGADTSTKPGDDFFRYANGTWIDRTPIPPDRAAYSLRLAMTDLTEQRLKDILETPDTQAADKSELSAASLRSDGRKSEPDGRNSTLEQKAGAFYRSFMDETRVEQLGAKAIDLELNDLKNAKTRDDFAALMGRTTTDFEFSLLILESMSI